jgi:hypothetical protein
VTKTEVKYKIQFGRFGPFRWLIDVISVGRSVFQSNRSRLSSGKCSDSRQVPRARTRARINRGSREDPSCAGKKAWGDDWGQTKLVKICMAGRRLLASRID